MNLAGYNCQSVLKIKSPKNMYSKCAITLMILNHFFIGHLISNFQESDSPRRSFSDNQISIRDPKSWKDPKISKLLKEGKAVSLCPMKEYLQSCSRKVEFDGDVFLVKLDNGLKAVFKRLPEDDLGDAYAEVAAYQASIVLGFPYIPPTVMTEINGMKGSLQLFIETEIDSLDSEIYHSALNKVQTEDLANLKLFYFVFGQWDSGPHNILILENEAKLYLIAIDNSGIRNHQYVKYGSLPFVRVLYNEKLQTNDWNQSFSFEKAKTIESPTIKKLRKVFSNTLPESFYRSFKAYNLPFRYIIFRNSLWRQYHAGHKEFDISFTKYLANSTKKALKDLDLAKLKRIFKSANNADFLTISYLEAILERRDQVLEFFDKQKKS